MNSIEMFKNLKGSTKIIISMVVIILALSALAIKLLIPTNHELKIGYFGNNIGNKLEASFQYYNGTDSKTIKFEAGDNVTVTYSLNAKKGDLQLEIKDKAGNEIISQGAGSGDVTFDVKETQDYTISIVALKAKGSYEVTWGK